jgi:hypothetical protein
MHFAAIFIQHTLRFVSSRWVTLYPHEAFGRVLSDLLIVYTLLGDYNYV